MKGYISGLFAVIIAISLAAFTQPDSPKSNLADYFFEFDIANHTPTQANVENPSNWVQVNDLIGCNNLDQMACKIKVPESTTNPGTPRTLKTSTIINADEYLTTGVYYVISGGSVLQKSNSEQ